MHRAPTADAETVTADRPGPDGHQRVLCAYSPRWLSGPSPRYRGLCPTWDGDEATAEHPAARTN
jgi:hypothetical protein